MTKSRLKNQMVWAQNTINQLKNNQDLSIEYIEVVITEAIAEYVSESIDLAMLIEIVCAVKESEIKLTPDLKSIVKDLTYLSQTHDPRLVDKILINTLRKVNNI